MSEYLIVTDSNADFTEALASQPGLKVLPMEFSVNDVSYLNDPLNHGMPVKEFYTLMRNGATTRTSAMNAAEFTDLVEPLIQAGNDILLMSFSGGLSGTADQCAMALRELSEKYPERKLLSVDTLCASMGQGLLVYLALQQKNAGKSIEEVQQWAIDNRLNLCHWFTVDDLMYLKRGGRVSAATAIVGSMLGIKPVLHVDDEGHLINMYTKRGRKASLRALIDEFKNRALDPENGTVFISHCDCETDAEFIAENLRKECGVRDIHIGYIGPVVGCHAGPGCAALFFVGKQR